MLNTHGKNIKVSLLAGLGKFTLSKSKMLVGSADYCDIRIEDSSVSELHAIIYISADKIQIQDLQSKNGIYVNGIKVEKQKISTDSTISFGNYLFDAVFTNDVAQILDSEAEVAEIKAPSITSFFEQALASDFRFDEQTDILTELPLNNRGLKDQYIDISTIESLDPRLEQSADYCLQMTTLCNGHIIELEHYKAKTNFLELNNGKKSIQNNLITVTDKQFVMLNGEDYNINIPENFEAHIIEGKTINCVSTAKLSFSRNQIASISRGSLQIFFKIVPTPAQLRQTPFFILEKSLQKDLGKVLGLILLPMLLLLFVNTDPKKPDKAIAIVYKRLAPVVSKNNEMMSEKVVDKSTGNQGEQQIKKESVKKVAQKVQQKVKQKMLKKKVASKTAAKAIRKIASVKTYKFKAATNLNSLFDSKVGEAKIVKKSSDVATDNFMATDSGSIESSRDSFKIAKVGNAKGATNYGVKGLSGKKGYQTAHIESETVVMGAMDPELLRKILQEYIPQFRHCYQQELNGNSDSVKGIIDLNFRITGNGGVNKINVAGKKSEFSKSGTNCVAGVLKLIHFPKPKGGGVVDVRQPLNFFSDSKTI
jgi:hypothetical protein